MTLNECWNLIAEGQNTESHKTEIHNTEIHSAESHNADSLLLIAETWICPLALLSSVGNNDEENQVNEDKRADMQKREGKWEQKFWRKGACWKYQDKSQWLEVPMTLSPWHWHYSQREERWRHERCHLKNLCDINQHHMTRGTESSEAARGRESLLLPARQVQDWGVLQQPLSHDWVNGNQGDRMSHGVLWTGHSWQC
jgi:hypothetical protein